MRLFRCQTARTRMNNITAIGVGPYVPLNLEERKRQRTPTDDKCCDDKLCNQVNKLIWIPHRRASTYVLWPEFDSCSPRKTVFSVQLSELTQDRSLTLVLMLPKKPTQQTISENEEMKMRRLLYKLNMTVAKANMRFNMKSILMKDSLSFHSKRSFRPVQYITILIASLERTSSLIVQVQSWTYEHLNMT